MKKSFILFSYLLCSYYISGQQPGSRSTAQSFDSIINRYLDSLKIDKTPTKTYTIYFKNNPDSGLQTIADRAKDSLLKKYLDIFDNLLRSGDIYPDKGSLSTPEQKIKYLIGYCILSNIYPTRTYMEALLESNPLFLFQKTLLADCPVYNPYPIKFQRQTIRKLKKGFYENYFTDKSTGFSNAYNIFELQENEKSRAGLFGTTASVLPDAGINFVDGDYFWNIVFCIIDTTGQPINNAITVTYHGHNASNVNSVGNATPAYASLSTGYTYIQLTKNNSTVPLKIRQDVYLIRDLINNAWHHPEGNIWQYDKNKALSQENTFILHIQLIK